MVANDFYVYKYKKHPKTHRSDLLPIKSAANESVIEILSTINYIRQNSRRAAPCHHRALLYGVETQVHSDEPNARPYPGFVIAYKYMALLGIVSQQQLTKEIGTKMLIKPTYAMKTELSIMFSR